MPKAAPSPCRHAGCRQLVSPPGFCVEHRRAAYRAQKLAITDDAKERNRFYQRAAWKRVRAQQLQDEPLCRRCRINGRLTAARVVDHVVPIINGGAELDSDNLQSLCKPCHDAKTRRDNA